MRHWMAAMSLAVAACSAEAPSEKQDVAEQGPPDIVQASAPNAPLAKERASQFTELDESKCKTTYRDDETGDWSGLCPGLGPIALELTSGDLRDDLEIIQAGHKVALGIPTIVAGGAFDSIGKTLEWRGPVSGPPDVLVARVLVARPDGTSDSGRLTVVKLGSRPCIVAVVPPQAGQSGKARAIADGKLPACLTS